MTKPSRYREFDEADMLTREQKQEIFAVGLLALALFVLLSLVPASIIATRAGEWFPSGNIVGPVGATVGTLLKSFFGASAFIVPGLLSFAGLRVGGWLSENWTSRLSVLAAGLLFLSPIATWVLLDSPDGAAGWLGSTLGAPLVDLIGVIGAVLVLGAGVVALSVGTLGWNPLGSVGRGVVAGGEVAGRTARVLADKGKILADKGKELADARAQAAEQRAVEAAGAEAGPVPGLEPEWMESSAEADAALEPTLERDAAEDEAGGAAVDAGEGDESEDPGDDGDPDDFEDGMDLEDPNAETEIEHEVPPMDLLSQPDARDNHTMDRQLDELGRVLIDKLKTFNVECTLGARTTGPMVTQFEVVPSAGVKVSRIANLDADLALAMKAKSVRIVAPIPGRGAVGVEIPNPQPEIVNLRNVLEAPSFRNATGELPLALGKDLNGRPYVANLEKMPHVLIAGATGAGKSVCLNTIVTSLVYRHTPETLRLLMIDPKMVELSVYSRLPHLRHNVVTDPRDAAGVLKWAVLEMERRYGLLKANYVRSIGEFNKKVRDEVTVRRSEPRGPEGDENRWIYQEGVLPFIVVVVDELADLMMTVQSEVEKPLTQLAQKARAIGIHLIVATQRPSVNIITGLIKANFPTRIAFRVASKTDSRTILDMNGADALLGNGDMLFLPPGESDPVRIQGAYLSTEDTERLMGWYTDLIERQQGEGDIPDTGEEPDILEEIRGQELEDGALVDEMAGDWDELFQAAAEACIQNGTGSTSLLQRRLSIGYGRAARIVDQLFDAGVIGDSDGSKGREVLMSLDELESFMVGGGD
jgi:S-DNA-T family DNA segregation ATPase FtsK/SpoIIIE